MKVIKWIAIACIPDYYPFSGKGSSLGTQAIKCTTSFLHGKLSEQYCIKKGFLTFIVFVPTQVVTVAQVVTSDNLGLTQVITMVPTDPSGNFLPQIRYTH